MSSQAMVVIGSRLTYESNAARYPDVQTRLKKTITMSRGMCRRTRQSKWAAAEVVCTRQVYKDALVKSDPWENEKLNVWKSILNE